MRRLSIILGVIISTAIAVIAVALYSPMGRQTIANIAEEQIGAALNGEAIIGEISGGLPGDIAINDITLADADGVWFTADALEVQWSPFAALSGRYVVKRVKLTNANYQRAPILPESEAAPTEPEPLTLPTNLPRLEIDEIHISDLVATVNGETYRIAGDGSVSIDPRHIAAIVKLRTADNRDDIDITAHINPDTDRLLILADIRSSELGAISTLTGVNGEIDITLTADSPLSNAAADLNAQIGDIAEIDAVLSGNLRKLGQARIVSTIMAGPEHRDIPELAEPVKAAINITDTPDGFEFDIQSLSSAIGDIAGKTRIRTKRSVLDGIETNLSLALAPDYHPEIQQLSGRDITLSSTLTRQGPLYAIDGAISSLLGELSFKEATSDLANTLSGNISLKINDDDALPAPFQRGAASTARLAITNKSRIQLSDLVITSPSGAKASGAIEVDLNSDQISGQIDVMAEPPFVTSLVPAINPSRDFQAEITIEGNLPDFAAKVDLSLPPMEVSKRSFDAATGQINLRGLPGSPAGTASLVGANKQKFLETAFESTGEVFSISALRSATEKSLLEASGRFNPTINVVDFRLTYDGENGAEPFPGIPLIGSIKAEGSIAPGREQNSLLVEAPTIQSGDLSLYGLDLKANGPSEALSANLNLQRLVNAGETVVDRLASIATAKIGDGNMVVIEQLTANLYDEPIALRSPMQIATGPSITVDNLRATIGSEGSLSFDGAFSKTRWTASGEITNLNIPDTESFFSTNFTLDTDQDKIASGDISLRSRDQSAAPIIGVAMRWDGKTLLLDDGQQDTAASLNFALPLALVREPSALSASFGGPINGGFAFDGNVADLASLLPPTLQSLAGKLEANFSLSGTTDAPELSGSAEFQNGEFTELASGLALIGINATANAAYRGGASMLSFTGGARGGDQEGADRLKFDGALTLGEETSITFQSEFSDLSLSAYPVSDLRLDGNILINGAPDDLNATGDIAINELNAEIITPPLSGLVEIAVTSDDASTQNPTALEPAASNIALDIAVDANDRIFIRGRGLESEWSASVRATTINGAPLVLGRSDLRRGWLDFSGRRFTLTTGEIIFDRLSPNNPILDLQASYETPNDVTATILVSGRGQSPVIELVSTPSLPPDDIMALVLFGKRTEELTALESVQTAQALASLGGVGPFGGGGLTSSLRGAVGLDLLNVDLDPETGGGSLTVGKYVADGVFVSASQEAGGGAGTVRVEYELTDNISVETELEQSGDQTVSANWKHDF